MTAVPVAEDGGRQFERTSLAWVRTGLSVLAVALLLVRQAGRDLVSVAPLVIAVVSSALAITAVRRGRLEHRSRSAQPPPSQVLGMAMCVLVLGIAALFIVV
jgi:uncharacterized membrane protein YidH (DUF202 family)